MLVYRTIFEATYWKYIFTASTWPEANAPLCPIQMPEKYVILTGSKNNAGDYLIKYRAKQLLAGLRPDREIIDMDAWKPLDSKQLDEINKAKALILCGGPSVQSGKSMRKNVYPLTPDLGKIRAPILMMGCGYKGEDGSWEEADNYPISNDGVDLLRKINEEGTYSSVRDNHTLRVLRRKGLDNFKTTGCPALFSEPHIGNGFKAPDQLESIGFSLGVSYRHSRSMAAQMKALIIGLLKRHPNAKTTVYFHHSINSPSKPQAAFISWLKKLGCAFEDISGSAEHLMKVYTDCDLHIGYRVHAHIFRSSISKPSILISEDGRAVALQDVIGGAIFNGFSKVNTSLLAKAMERLIGMDRFTPNMDLPKQVFECVDQEFTNGFQTMSTTRDKIDEHYEVMQDFIQQLP